MKADFQALMLAHNTALAGKFLINHKELAPILSKKLDNMPNVSKGRNNSYWVQGQLCANRLCAIAFIILKGWF